MPDPTLKATMHFGNWQNPTAGACDLGLIPARKPPKAAQSGAARRDSGVLVCFMAHRLAFFGQRMSGQTGPKEHSI